MRPNLGGRETLSEQSAQALSLKVPNVGPVDPENLGGSLKVQAVVTGGEDGGGGGVQVLVHE